MRKFKLSKLEKLMFSVFIAGAIGIGVGWKLNNYYLFNNFALGSAALGLTISAYETNKRNEQKGYQLR